MLNLSEAGRLMRVCRPPYVREDDYKMVGQDEVDDRA